MRGIIIATHGVGDSAFSLVDIARAFGQDFRVYLVDLLGHGLAPRLTEKQLQEPFAAVAEHFENDVERIVTEAPGGLPVVLMGHSFGGAVAAHVAQRNPALIDALILEDPALLTQSQAQSYWADAASLSARMAKQASDPAQAIIDLKRDYPAWSTAEYTGWAQAKTLVDANLLATGTVGTVVDTAINHTEKTGIFSTFAMPTLLVTGDGADVLFDSARLAQATATSPVEGAVIPGASHTVRRDKSTDFYATVESFLARVLPKQASETKAFIREDLKVLVDGLPPQTTWDAPAMRKSGAARHLPHQFAPGVTASEFKIVSCTGIGHGVASLAETNAQPHMRAVPHALTVRVVAHEDVRHGRIAPEAVFFCVHGGGYVGGKPEYDDVRHEALIQHFHPAVAVSPDYRLSPENPYPAGVIDTVAALVETARRYSEVPIIAYGDSAGAGTLAQVFARLEDFAPDQVAQLRAQVKSFIAVEPCLDPAMDTASWVTYADGPVWYKKASEAAWDGYLPEKPAFTDLMPIDKNLVPPTMVVVNPADPLRDEGIDWARMLIDNGVDAELHVFSGTVHGLATIPATPSWDSLVYLIEAFNREL